jgi:peptidoglycan/LPS O-acetylase OafA/YrhL
MAAQIAPSRIYSLDSLRGIAAMIVVIHHFLLVFYPALFTTQNIHSHTNGNAESVWAYAWCSFIWNGNFAVCLFFVLSGYALSLGFFADKNKRSPAEGFLKRYPRLVIPVTASVLLSWLMLSLNAYQNISVGQAYTNNVFWFANLWNISPDILSALHEGFLQSVFYGGTLEYNPVLWTINLEFFGSLLVFACLSIVGSIRNRVVIYVLLSVLLYKSYFLAFILGMVICDYRYSVYYRRMPAIVITGTFAAALYAGGFHWLRFLPAGEWGVFEYVAQTSTQIVYIIASAVILITIISTKRVLAPVLHRTGNWLGRISFSVYLLHLLVIGSFSCHTLRFLIDRQMNYHIACGLTFFSTLVLIFVTSHFFHLLVDKPAIRFSQNLFIRLFLRTSETTTSKEISTTRIVKAE